MAILRKCKQCGTKTERPIFCSKECKMDFFNDQRKTKYPIIWKCDCGEENEIFYNPTTVKGKNLFKSEKCKFCKKVREVDTL